MTFNVNLSSGDFRPPTNAMPTPQQGKVACHQGGMAQGSCADLAELDLKDISKLFQIDGQKSAMQTINLQQSQLQVGTSQNAQAAASTSTFNPN